MPYYSNISKDSITWAFSVDASGGTYLNGDYWVLGPVVISSITPQTAIRTAGTMKNCSFLGESINSSSQTVDQGLNSFLTFLASANIASGISTATPLILTPGQRLISISSVDLFPPVHKAAVLTCVSSVPPTNSFRPGYTDSTIDYIDGSAFLARYSTKLADIDLTELLTKVEPTAAAVSASVSSFWFDPWTGIKAQELRPISSMPYKDPNYAATIGNAALSINYASDFDKSGIARHLTQIGIDNYSNLVNLNNYWAGPGAIGSGKKFTILFAGVMLDHDDMMEIGYNYPVVSGGPNRFTEDNSTFFVSSYRNARGTLIVNGGYGDYVASDVYLPEWGLDHWTDASLDSSTWVNASSYGTDERRFFTMKNWAGYLYAAKVMGMQELWNHKPLFAYFNRYFKKEQEIIPSTSSFNIKETLAPSGMEWQYDYVSGLNAAYFSGNASYGQLSSIEYHGISNVRNRFLYVSSNPASPSGNLLLIVSSPLIAGSGSLIVDGKKDYAIQGASSITYVNEYDSIYTTLSFSSPTMDIYTYFGPKETKSFQVLWYNASSVDPIGSTNAVTYCPSGM